MSATSHSDSTVVFGKATSCKSLDEIARLIQESPEERATRKQAAAYGMILSASQATVKTELFDDTRAVLDSLAKAKAQIDIASWHDIEIAKTTAHILSVAQEFVDETTIPCTEWATPSEVIDVVSKAAQEHASA